MAVYGAHTPSHYVTYDMLGLWGPAAIVFVPVRTQTVSGHFYTYDVFP